MMIYPEPVVGTEMGQRKSFAFVFWTIKDFVELVEKVTFILFSPVFLACYYDYKNVLHITLGHCRVDIMHVAGQYNRSAFKPSRSYFSVTKPLLSSMLCIFEQQNLG